MRVDSTTGKTKSGKSCERVDLRCSIPSTWSNTKQPDMRRVGGFHTAYHLLSPPRCSTVLRRAAPALFALRSARYIPARLTGSQPPPGGKTYNCLLLDPLCSAPTDAVQQLLKNRRPCFYDYDVSRKGKSQSKLFYFFYRWTPSTSPTRVTAYRRT